jgi:predicted  nucleic acid-binding Zn-ribbon protein
MTVTADLFALQEADSALDACERELAEVRSKLAEEDSAGELRAQVAEQEARLAIARGRAADLETAIRDLQEKVSPVERKLYSGEVRIPKELQALQEDLEMLLRQRRELEDQDLAVMEEVEAAGAALGAARSRLDEYTSSYHTEHTRLVEREGELVQRREQLQANRERRAARIDPQRRGLYDRLRTARRGIAVVRVERGVCTGCRITLPTTVQQRARSGMQAVQCTSCERILFAG